MAILILTTWAFLYFHGKVIVKVIVNIILKMILKAVGKILTSSLYSRLERTAGEKQSIWKEQQERGRECHERKQVF